MIITVDGPAGSGKSTVARLLANRLEMQCLDTGAMYRGLTAWCLDHGIDPAAAPDRVVQCAREASIGFDWSDDPPTLVINGQSMTHRLRDTRITGHVSDVAGLSGVREVMVQAQRRIGSEHPRLVTEGRDQGSVVFPHAQLKFFLDASVQVRAARRAEQDRQAGREVNERRVREAIIRRDARDAQRPDGPMVCPPDAQRIDTSGMTIEQVTDRLETAVLAMRPSDARAIADAGPAGT